MKKIISITTLCLVLCALSLPAYGHSGRTDSSGGHRDNNNVSGLGYYHFHCNGSPAHLHDKGYCPYKEEAEPELYTASVATTPAPQPAQVAQLQSATVEAVANEIHVNINGQAFSAGTLLYQDSVYVPLNAFLSFVPQASTQFNSQTKTTAVTIRNDLASLEEKAAFLDENIAIIVSEEDTTYHTIDCSSYKNCANFFAVNTTWAESQNYTKCPYCH